MKLARKILQAYGKKNTWLGFQKDEKLILHTYTSAMSVAACSLDCYGVEGLMENIPCAWCHSADV